MWVKPRSRMAAVAATSACGSAKEPRTHVSLTAVRVAMVSVRPGGEGAGAGVGVVLAEVGGVLQLHLQLLHLAHGHRGHELEEEEEERGEEPQRADVDAPVHPGGRV